MKGNIFHATVCPGLILIRGNIILLQISDQEAEHNQKFLDGIDCNDNYFFASFFLPGKERR
jgi:hypothetical protein